MEKNKFTEDYYDKDYFVTTGGKKIKLADGTVKEWSYANPSGDWHGAGMVSKAWNKVFNPKKMLDVGAGRGVFIAYARKEGIEAEGFDFSHFAAGEGRFYKCKKEWMIQHDATQRWPYSNGKFDFTVCLDLMEHIYEEDIDFLINELFRVSSKYIFLQIAVPENFEYSFKKDESIPEEYKVYTLTGHVLMKKREWWFKKLERTGWRVNQTKVDEFFNAVVPPLTEDCAWKRNLVTVIEKVCPK